MNLRSFLKGVFLLAASSALIVAVSLMGLVAFVFYNSSGGRDWGVPVEKVSDALTRRGAAYAFAGEGLLEADCWAMLLDEGGQVIWSLRKPDDLPEQYALTDVAAFTRWYLDDYPVQCWVREDGLLVVGSPKGSIWKHDVAMDTGALLQTPLWFGVIFLLALGCVLALAYWAARRWFRQAQQMRDDVRSDWINDISHDIRTPLSMVMGYAAQMESAPDLAPAQQKQAGIIRAQSQVIRDLVNDLNLTMRLDSAMQALRKETFHPAAFLRQAAADFLNSGLAEGYPFEIDLPDAPMPTVEADPFLLRRAVNNLLTNCVRHNDPGCPIQLGAQAESGRLVLWVEGGAGEKPAPAGPDRSLESDGGAAHGTGLRLVEQIAAAHGGEAKFYAGAGTPFRCELWLPLTGGRP